MRYALPYFVMFASLTVAIAVADDRPANQPPTADRVRAGLEEISTRLHFFTAETFAHGMMLKIDFDKQYYRLLRESEKKPITEIEEFINADLQAIKPVFWPEYAPDTLIPLLKHGDPKVRTLAAAALVAIDPIRHVTAIEPLLEDSSATFPNLPRYDYSHPSPPKPQSVADVIRTFAHPVDADQIRRLDAWRSVTGRRFTCGELLEQLYRAERAQDCYAVESKERIAAINGEIAQLPMPDRAWYQIALVRRQRFEPGRPRREFDLDAEGDLVELTAQLSHDQILNALRRRLDTQDPTVQSPGIKEAAGKPAVLVSISDSIRRFILDHADRLLKPSDIDFLLMREKVEPEFTGLRNPIWAIAAARIDPRRAPTFLLPALDRWPLKLQERERQSIVMALRELSTETPVEFFVDWFYRESCSQGSEADLLARFLRQMSQMHDPDGRFIIAAIVRDRRFDESPPEVVEEVNQILNERLGRDQLISHREIDRLSHPMGRQLAWWQRDEAARKYPVETGHYLEALANWRQRIRDQLPKYLAAPPTQAAH